MKPRLSRLVPDAMALVRWARQRSQAPEVLTLCDRIAEEAGNWVEPVSDDQAEEVVRAYHERKDAE